VGRYGNRIAFGRFSLDGIEYNLAANNGDHHLHGGLKGFDKVVWDAEEISENAAVGVRLRYLSRNGEEGYPGNLSTEVSIRLTNAGELRIDMRAETDKTTIINLTHHGYFNLTAGKSDILNHRVTILADRYTVVDDELIPTGELRLVSGTPWDFRTPRAIGSRIEQVSGGYDHNYQLDGGGGDMALAARVFDPESGRTMEVFTTEPGLQFYIGNFLDGRLTGKQGIVYRKHWGFCMETQHFPDSPNQPAFPPVVLRPGEIYSHAAVYKFGVR
jgi:aldose 1-epimerase